MLLPDMHPVGLSTKQAGVGEGWQPGDGSEVDVGETGRKTLDDTQLIDVTTARVSKVCLIVALSLKLNDQSIALASRAKRYQKLVKLEMSDQLMQR